MSNPGSSLAELCHLLRIPAPLEDCPGEPAFLHRRVKANAHLVCAGEAFDSLFVLANGFMKASLIGTCGSEQVTAFPVKGDLLGVDALSIDRHVTGIVALTDCEVVILPMSRIAQLGHDHPGLARSLLRLIAGELVREQAMVATLSMPSAEARVAHFLIEQGQRMKALGYSAREFVLRMTRRDIGSYLSLQLETVSRTFSAMARAGLIDVERRSVRLVDFEGLCALDSFAHGERSARASTVKPISWRTGDRPARAAPLRRVAAPAYSRAGVKRAMESVAQA